MHLYHKLCFEEMLENLAITQDFKMLYEYMDAFDKTITCLRVPTIDKTKLKSNHYWLMVVVSKMSSLRVIKFHMPKGG